MELFKASKSVTAMDDTNGFKKLASTKAKAVFLKFYGHIPQFGKPHN